MSAATDAGERSAASAARRVARRLVDAGDHIARDGADVAGLAPFGRPPRHERRAQVRAPLLPVELVHSSVKKRRAHSRGLPTVATTSRAAPGSAQAWEE